VYYNNKEEMQNPEVLEETFKLLKKRPYQPSEKSNNSYSSTSSYENINKGFLSDLGLFENADEKCNIEVNICDLKDEKETVFHGDKYEQDKKKFRNLSNFSQSPENEKKEHNTSNEKKSTNSNSKEDHLKYESLE
jgi:hypothetical protein